MLFLVAGNSALNLPPLDPFLIEQMQIKQGGESPVNIVIDFKKVKLLGISGINFYKTM
jgi:Haemolymph juvenile hormone binding protein (JHBP)